MCPWANDGVTCPASIVPRIESGSTPEPRSVADSRSSPPALTRLVSRRTRGGVVSLTQNSNVNRPAPAAFIESKTTAYVPGGVLTAPTTGPGLYASGQRQGLAV